MFAEAFSLLCEFIGCGFIAGSKLVNSREIQGFIKKNIHDFNKGTLFYVFQIKHFNVIKYPWAAQSRIVQEDVVYAENDYLARKY